MNIGARRVVLLADDNADDQFLFGEAFKAAGGDPRDLRMVSSGDEAAAYLSGSGPYADRAEHPFPALVLLDIKMPRRSGLEVLEWIREQPRLECLPVVMLTASSLPADVERAYRLRANSYICKPSTLAALTEMTVLLRRYWLALNEPGPAAEG